MYNISKLSLAALREQINAQTRTVEFQTDDGAVTQMVYVPKFTVPAGIFENGAYPKKDMNLGGFFIDKYSCSHKKATAFTRGIGDGASITSDDTTNIPVSLPGKVVWTQIDWTNAKQACANRKINGQACHLVTMKEWATVCFLAKLMGHDIRGNNSNGHDYRDTNDWQHNAVPDSTQPGRVLSGTGPVSWSHNGLASGIFDLVGGVWEWLDFTITDGVYTHKKKALINDSDGITAADKTITIDGMENGDTWPAAGTIQIEDEIITYSTINYQGNGKAVLSDCTRAQQSTKAATHADNTTVYQLTKYCITPGGATAYISNSAGLSTSDTAIVYTDLLNGPGNSGFAVGDTIQVENEQMKVTAVVSNTLTVTRAVNGSSAASHAKGVAVAKVSTQMDNNDPSNDAWQFGHLTTMRTENDLECMALPSLANQQTDEWKDGFWIRNHGVRAALRGGSWLDGANARSGFALYLSGLPSDRWVHIGFRAALSLENL
jgi:hypothetical protein